MKEEEIKQLAEKIVNDLQRRCFIRSGSKEVARISIRNVVEIITDHFKPDGELVERARQWRENLSGTIEGESLLTYANIDKMLASFHLQESGSGLDLGFTPSRLWRLAQKYNCDDFVQMLNEIGSKPTPIDDKEGIGVDAQNNLNESQQHAQERYARSMADDKGIAARAKVFYECNAGKYVTQPSGTWDMLADFAISELSRLPQGKEDAEKSWEENKVQPNQVEKSLELLEKYLKETPKEEIEALLESIPNDPNGITIEDYFARFGCDCEQGEWISVVDRLPEDLDKEYLLLLEITDDPPYEEIFVGQFGETNEWGIWEKSIGDGLITHWMPLPKPPKGK